MANIIPQLAPASEDRVTGGQVIDGCLKFDSTKTQYLKRTPGSAGNRKHGLGVHGLNVVY